jgi:PLP dependent protein
MEALTEAQRDTLAANLERVRRRLRAAATAAGRDPAGVDLVAVTKEAPPEVIPELLDLGVRAIGENRAEMIWKKQALCDRAVPWHMIGHYQRNKVDKSVPLLSMVHSIHSMDLLGILDAKLASSGAPERLPILLQVNVTGEASKQGFTLAEIRHVADIAAALTRVQLAGLMTMAPADAGPDELHEVFGTLRELRARLGRDRLPELSMGMSQDFEIAVAEGATLVRIGSALFGGIDFAR